MRINEAIKEIMEGEPLENGEYVGLFQDGMIHLEISDHKFKIEVYDSDEAFLREVDIKNPCFSRIINKKLFY